MNNKVKHEIEAALIWLQEQELDRVKLHLAFALSHLNDEAVEQGLQSDVEDSTDEEESPNPYILSAPEIERTLAQRR